MSSRDAELMESWLRKGLRFRGLRSFIVTDMLLLVLTKDSFIKRSVGKISYVEVFLLCTCVFLMELEERRWVIKSEEIRPAIPQDCSHI